MSTCQVSTSVVSVDSAMNKKRDQKKRETNGDVCCLYCRFHSVYFTVISITSIKLSILFCCYHYCVSVGFFFLLPLLCRFHFFFVLYLSI